MLTHRFITHPVAANMLMLIMIIAGCWGLIQLPAQFLPHFDLNMISVNVSWVGASSSDIENSIIVPLEKELRDVDHLKRSSATARQSQASILLEFIEGTDMGSALNQVKEKVSQVRNLPEDAEEPSVTTRVMYEPIAKLIITHPDGLEVLRPLARRFEDELLNRGIAKVSINGLPKEEIAIQIPRNQIQSLQKSLPQIATMIAQRSVDVPAGDIGSKESSRQLRSLEQKRNTRDFAKLPLITKDDGRLVRLGDIATIERRARDNEIFYSYQGQPALMLDVLRIAQSDALKSAEILHAWYQETLETLPPSIKLTIFDERWQYIKDRLNTLIKNGIQGLLLVLAILFLFLNKQVATWVAIGIPIAFLGAIGLMPSLDVSVNMISMFALIMVLGVVVDDAIVVGEEAHALYSNGIPLLKAIETSIERMFYPILSSSLTTVSAFIPLVVVGGVMGQILLTIPIVVVTVISASLIECFLILPSHLYHSLSKHNSDKRSDFRENIDRRFNDFKHNTFKPFIAWSLKFKWLIVTASIAFFIVAIMLLTTNKVAFTFFPSPEETVFKAHAKFYAGTNPKVVDQYIKQLEQSLWATDKHFGGGIVKDAIVTHRALLYDRPPFQETGDNFATVNVELTPGDTRDTRNHVFIEEWLKRNPKISNLEAIEIIRPRAGPPGNDIDIVLKGDQPLVLKQAAMELQVLLAKYDGVSSIQDDLPYGKQELIFALTPIGNQVSLTITDIGRQLRAAYSGALIQVFHDKEEELEVRLSLPDYEQDYFASLASFPIITPQGEVLPLANLVNFRYQPGLQVLKHHNNKLSVHVTADVDPNVSNSNLILAELKEQALPNLLNKYNLTYSLEGLSLEQGETLRDMLLGIAIALILIYIILSWVFASYTWPIIILMIVPFGVAGAIYGHLLMGLDLTLLSLFGLFGLTGIVINDSIILVNAYKRLREDGQVVIDAIINASSERLRAVMLTSLTTIAGLTPLLFETSTQAQFLIPMATSIAFGLAFATVLILIVMPTLLYIYEARDFSSGD